METDDAYWMPTDPPYRVKRPVAERLELLSRALDAPAWVLTGSADGWGDAILARAEGAVLVETPAELRLARLRARERARFGARIGEGGDMEAHHRAFLDWAAGYDDPAFPGRNRARHERGLAALGLPLLRLAGTRPPADLVAAVLAWAGERAA